MSDMARAELSRKDNYPGGGFSVRPTFGRPIRRDTRRQGGGEEAEKEEVRGPTVESSV